MVKLQAADGYLSLRQHMENIFERLSVMDIEHLPQSYKELSGQLLSQHALMMLRNG